MCLENMKLYPKIKFFYVIILLINEPAFIVSYTYASQETLKWIEVNWIVCILIG